MVGKLPSVSRDRLSRPHSPIPASKRKFFEENYGPVIGTRPKPVYLERDPEAWFFNLILEELEKARDFVNVFQVAKGVAEKLHVEPSQAFRNRIRYRLNKLFFRGKVELQVKKGERGFFLTNYYKLRK